MITDKDLIQLNKTYSTPTFVFNEDELTARASAIKEILDGISLCFSIKANPFLIRPLTPIVDYFEVCSPGELAICVNLNVPAPKIIYSGVNKGHEDTKKAIEYGAAILTAESISQYNLIDEEAERQGQTVDVILRLSSNNQFGMSLSDIESILSSTSSAISIKGIHFFAGTGRKQSDKQRNELQNLCDVIENLRNKYKADLPMLEYGPGLPYPYFSTDDRSDTLAPLKNIVGALKDTENHVELSVEMGRFIASSCGYYMTSICDIKTSAETNWCIVDGGINHVNYLGQTMGMKIPVIRHYRNGSVIDDTVGNTYTLCGSLCTTNDILVRSLPLNDPSIGDLLVFENIGAYSVTEALGLFLSRTLPQVVLYSNGTPTLVRDRKETWPINSFR